jgi:hypothetical protein
LPLHYYLDLQQQYNKFKMPKILGHTNNLNPEKEALLQTGAKPLSTTQVEDQMNR